MTLVLDAQKREKTGKQVTALRRAGDIPAVVYGNVKENVHVQVNGRDFKKVFSEAGESTLIDLKIDAKEPIKILIHDVQLDPVSRAILHADFLAINMSEKIRTEVELKYIGESKAVKELGGILVKNLDAVEIECLPKDLVHEIVVDMSVLQTFEDRITLADIAPSAGITYLEKPDVAVAFVAEPRSEEEIKELDAVIEGSVEEVEVEEKGKKEEEGEESATEGEPKAEGKPVEQPAKEEKKAKK